MRAISFRWRLPLAASMFVLMCLPTASSAVNFLVNPGFESGCMTVSATNVQTASGYGWTFQCISGDDVVRPETFFTPPSTYPYGPTQIGFGTQSMRNHTRTAAGGSWYIYQDVPVQAQVQYTASAWVRARNNGTGFGTHAGDIAGIWITELTSSMTENYDHGLVASITQANTVYQQISATFTTQPGTAYIRYSLYMNIGCNYNQGSFSWDDCALDGPAPPCDLSGVVSSDGVPIQGATVQVGTQTTTTGPDGSYSFTGLPAMQSVTISAFADGYYKQNKTRILPSGSFSVDFQLVAKGQNLLINPGFDEGFAGGWNYDATRGFVEAESIQQGTDSHFYDSGEEAAMIRVDSQEGSGLIYQNVTVQPNSPYVASVRFRGNINSGKTTLWGSDPNQVAALFVQEYDSAGWPVGAEQRAYADPATATTDWQTLNLSLTTAPNTAYIRIGGYAYLLDDYPSTGSRAIFDSFVLSGNAGAAIANLQGCVKSGSAPVEGATVQTTTGGYSTVTDANGFYTLSVPLGSSYGVLATADGYYSQLKTRVINAAEILPFDLTAVGDNLLKSAGFDYQITNWTYDLAGDIGDDLINKTPLNYSTAYSLSGDHALYLTNASSTVKERIAYQDILVNPSTEYIYRGSFMPACTVWKIGAVSWGTNPDQNVALTLREYGVDGNPIGEEQRTFATITPDDILHWLTLSTSITTSPETVKVRVGIYAKIYDNYYNGLPRAVFDNMEFNGPPLNDRTTLTGTVSSGGVPLQGATVTCADVSTTTAADGSYTLSGVPVGQADIRATMPGYLPQRKSRTLYVVVNHVDFDLAPVGNNLLANPGFDDGFPNGWMLDLVRAYANNEGTLKAPDALYTDSHEGAAAIYIATREGSGAIYQNVSVKPNSAYTASVRFRGAVNAGQTSVWGTDPNQVAALYVQEYDAAGIPIGGEQRVYADTAQALTEWQTLALPITTSANTAYLRVGGYAYMQDDFDTTRGRAIFDTFALNGEAGPGVKSIQGVVTSGGVPLPGALVAVLDTEFSAISGPDGTYSIDGLPADIGNCVTRASKDGYFSQRIQRTLTGPEIMTFELPPLGGNLLVNPGFEDGLIGWLRDPVANNYFQRDLADKSWAPVYSHAGYTAGAVLTDSPGTRCAFYQDVPVMPGSDYSLSGWFRPGFPAWRADAVAWGVNGSQTAGLFAQEYDGAGSPVGTVREVSAVVTTENRDQWQQVVLPTFTTSPDTLTVRVGAFANMYDAHSATVSRAVFDDFLMTGPAVNAITLKQLKTVPDDTAVYVVGQVVSAVFDGFFYIEDADRSSGIKVAGTFAGIAPGNTVNIRGVVATLDGERVITATSIVASGLADAPAPLGTNNRALGSGLSPVGLYVTVWGRVDAPGGNPLTISDGSGGSLKVYPPSGYSSTGGEYVSVTGALGAELSGTDVVPVMHAVTITPQD